MAENIEDLDTQIIEVTTRIKDCVVDMDLKGARSAVHEHDLLVAKRARLVAKGGE